MKSVIRARRPKDEADKIIQKLAEYRHLRNLLAHYPCWLEPVNDAELRQTIALKLFIADRSYVWEIDHAQAVEWVRPPRETLRPFAPRTQTFGVSGCRRCLRRVANARKF